MFVSENHLEVVRLRLAGLTNAQISETTGLKKATIQDWISKLNRFYGTNIKARVGCTLPCEICQERVYLKKVLKHVRCEKHKKPMVWLNPDTPAYTNKREYDNWLYHSSIERKSKTAKRTLKWLHRKKATDPEWMERFRKYHRDYRAQKKVLKLQSVG